MFSLLVAALAIAVTLGAHVGYTAPASAVHHPVVGVFDGGDGGGDDGGGNSISGGGPPGR